MFFKITIKPETKSNITCVTISMLLLYVTMAVSCTNSASQEPVHKNDQVGMAKDTCDDPDADISCCFVSLPSSLSNVMNIAGKTEPGERLIISGTIFHGDGKTPFSDVTMYAYHTDINGKYTRAGPEKGFQKWHGKLHGWCKTGADGKYEIHTIRPASYPNSTALAHIHSALRLPGSGSTFFISDFIFADDPNLKKQGNNLQTNPGGNGLVDLMKSNGIWYGARNIIVD